jgi:hypothetical protein
MGGGQVAGDDGVLSSTIQEILVMTTSVTVPQVTFPVRRLSQHEILVARLAVAHDNGAHVSPQVACFKCLHGDAPAFIALRKAA